MPDFVIYPHAGLSRRAVNRPVDAQMIGAGDKLLAATSEVQAYGLAAAHLGLNEPLVVVSVAGQSEARDYRVLYNPAIVDAATETAADAEGSVSLPGIQVPLARAVWVEVGYDDAEGQRQSMRLEGFAARVAQHEIDQVNGVFFLDRLSRLKRDTALRKFRKQHN